MSEESTTRVRLTDDGQAVDAPSGVPLPSKTDWERVDALTDEDIREAAADVPDDRPRDVRELQQGYRVPQFVDVKAIRAKLRLSQGAFARKYGFSVDALQEWEQGRRQPGRATRVLLTVIDHEPEAVDRALAPREASTTDYSACLHEAEMIFKADD